jgi:hypothetical protein
MSTTVKVACASLVTGFAYAMICNTALASSDLTRRRALPKTHGGSSERRKARNLRAVGGGRDDGGSVCAIG